MVTSRRPEVTQRKARPPVDHCNKNVAPSSFTELRLLDDGEVAWGVVETARPLVSGHHDVFESHAESTLVVDARLNAERMAGDERERFPGNHVGMRVRFLAHT